MKKRIFTVTVYREWTETGRIDVKAIDEDEARDLAKEMLSDDNDAFEWDGSNMEPGNQDVEDVSEKEK